MCKLVRILKKEAGHVGQQPCADSGWYGTNGAASVHDVMQWIPTVYKYLSPVETYTICFWRMFRPQTGPICYYCKDAVVQTDLSLTVDGHVWAKATLLSVCAVPPMTDKEHAQEIQLYSPRGYYLGSNIGQGIRTDLSIELPQSVYGNVTGHPNSPLAGIVRLESAVIRLCSKDNIQLFVYNSSGEECNIQRGDLLASVVLLQNFVPILEIKPYNG